MKRIWIILLAMLMLCAITAVGQAENAISAEEEVYSGNYEEAVPELEVNLCDDSLMPGCDLSDGDALNVPNQEDGEAECDVLAAAGNNDASQTIVFDENEFEIYGGTLRKYKGAGGNVVIPYGVVAIASDAFENGGSVTSIIIPDTVTSISNYAFFCCGNLASIQIPSSITSIEKAVFSNCKSLQSITIPNSVTSIEDNAFYNCTALKSVTIPNSVTSIGSDAFAYCSSMTYVTIPDSVTEIDGWAFAYCDSLKDVYFEIPKTYNPERKFTHGDSVFTSSVYDRQTVTFHISCMNIAYEWAKNVDLSIARHPVIEFTTAHPASVLPAVSPTYTSTGLTEGQVCSVCGKVLIEQKKVKKLSLPKNGILLEEDESRKVGLGFKYTVHLNGVAATSFKSSNTKIATVSSTGTIKPKKKGKATITVTDETGEVYKLKLTVKDLAALSSKKEHCVKGESVKLSINNLGDRKVTWSTSDKSIATVKAGKSGKATVSGKKYGKVTITAKIKNGKTLKCELTVGGPLTIEVRDIDDVAVYNDLYVKLTNHSKKKITYAVFDIIQYNNRGDKLRSPYSHYYLNETIYAHDYEYKTYWIHNDAKRVTFNIKEVTFSNGQKWKP